MKTGNNVADGAHHDELGELFLKIDHNTVGIPTSFVPSSMKNKRVCQQSTSLFHTPLSVLSANPIPKLIINCNSKHMWRTIYWWRTPTIIEASSQSGPYNSNKRKLFGCRWSEYDQATFKFRRWWWAPISIVSGRKLPRINTGRGSVCEYIFFEFFYETMYTHGKCLISNWEPNFILFLSWNWLDNGIPTMLTHEYIGKFYFESAE